MPQMSPINWLTLSILFIIVYLIFIILNYYSFIYKPDFSKNLKLKTFSNWKW